jgi:hypothetical protein
VTTDCEPAYFSPPPESHRTRASVASAFGSGSAGACASAFLAFQAAYQPAVEERRTRFVGVVVRGRERTGGDGRAFISLRCGEGLATEVSPLEW